MADRSSSQITRSLRAGNVNSALGYTAGKTGLIDLYQSLGSPIKTFTIDKVLASSGTALTDNAIRYVALQVFEASTTISNFVFYSKVQGNFTGDNTNGLALYSYSAGTMTKIGETANDEAIWKNTANTFVTVALATPVAVTSGTYYVGLIYNQSAQTTAPQIDMTSIGTPNASQSNVLFTNSAFTTGQITGQNSFPSTQATS